MSACSVTFRKSKNQRTQVRARFIPADAMLYLVRCLRLVCNDFPKTRVRTSNMNSAEVMVNLVPGKHI